jgi:hypothetical protein
MHSRNERTHENATEDGVGSLETIFSTVSSLFLAAHGLHYIATGSPLCFFPRHAVIHQVGNPFFEVFTYRLRPFAISALA